MRIVFKLLTGIVLLWNFLLFANESSLLYPTRPVKIIVPYGPGGAADQLARIIADKFSYELKQSFIIENIAGAGTIIGTDKVAKSTADGYTLLLCSSTTFVNNPVFKKNLPYKVETDFIGIGLLSNSPMVLVTSPTSTAQTLQDFIRYAKEHPGKVSYASAGPGSSLQLAAELFQAQTGTKMLHIPYKSNVEATQAVLSNQVDIAFDIALSSVSLINAKKLKALGLTNTRGLAILENIPTIAESGVPGYTVNAWYGLAAPIGTPTEVIQKLHSTLQKILSDKEIKIKFDQLGMDLLPSNTEALMLQVNKEKTELTQLIKARNIQID